MTANRKVSIQAALEWRARKSEASARWIGVCDALNLATEADSLDELHSLIEESIHMLMTDLLEDNELDAFLRARGWEAHDMPVDGELGQVEFDVPWELIAEGARGPERRAH